MDNEENEVINKIKGQNVIKNVLFFKISTEDPSMLATDERLNLIIDRFNYETVNYRNKIGNSTEFIIEEIKKDNKFFFGSICKIDDLIDPFTKLKLANENKDIANDEVIFNHYTYFYIDYESLYISCIVSKNIQSPEKYIYDFLNFNNVALYKITPLSKSLKEINQYINSFRLSFADNADFAPMNAMEKLGCEIKDFKVQVKMKSKGDNFIDKFKEVVAKNKKHLRIASVGNDEEDYDLLKGVFSKKAKIKIPTNFEDKLDTIMLLLKEQLINAKQTKSIYIP